jgi:hypothetical protein
MKRNQFIVVVALLATVITLASCWNICGCSPSIPPPTPREILAGKTYTKITIKLRNKYVSIA